MSLNLSKTEKERVKQLLKEWKYDAMTDIEEDVCGTASYHFEVTPSGIGDFVYLCYKKHREFISDDNF